MPSRQFVGLFSMYCSLQSNLYWSLLVSVGLQYLPLLVSVASSLSWSLLVSVGLQ